jgi:hypothetical protein
MAYWFHLQFGVDPGRSGAIFFAANLLAAVSSLLGGTDRRPHRADQHDGLHPPAVEPAADPRAADADAAAGGRRPAAPLHAEPDGRPDPPVVRDGGRRARRALARPGITGIARTTGAAISPSISSVLVAEPAIAALPFYLAGGLKILYDLLMYRDFRNVQAARGAAGLGVRTGRPDWARFGATRHPEPPPDEQHDRDHDGNAIARSKG